MTYLRTLPLALVVLAACTSDPGDESSTSDGSSSGGASDTSATSSPTEPTGEPTTAGSSGSDSESATTAISSTSESSTTSEDSTTGGLACADVPDYVASFAAWEQARDANANTYFYSVLRGPSGLVPPDYCIYRTLVAVVDGQVVERRFEISEMFGEADCDKTFTEKGDEVGTGTADYLAPAVTVDELYAACCDMVLHIQPADEFTVTFSTDKEGLMNTCYYVANGCADGCDGGPLGAALAFEKLDFGAPPPAP